MTLYIQLWVLSLLTTKKFDMLIILAFNIGTQCINLFYSITLNSNGFFLVDLQNFGVFLNQ
jgi:hypothetical protein